MPWKEVTIPLQRLESATLATAEGANRRRLCRRSGISPKTGCKWLHRFQEGRPHGLQARSGRPHHSQQRDADISILWGNTSEVTGDQIYNIFSSYPTISYSLVQDSGGSAGSWDINLGNDGGGNIDADPQFVDANGPDDIVGTLDDNPRLQLTSPAIDAGDNDAVPADTLDLDGDLDSAEMLPYDLDGYPRCVDIPDTGVGPGPIVDMGAYEVQVKVYLPLVMKNYAP
jgi:hypothetical protein